MYLPTSPLLFEFCVEGRYPPAPLHDAATTPLPLWKILLSLEKLIFVEDSPVHGKGVFCRIPIPQGTYIGTYESDPSTEDGTYVLWIEEEDGTETGWDGINDLRFLNHSYEPNAELDGLDLYSLRDLVPGEEVFIDYQWDPEEDPVDETATQETGDDELLIDSQDEVAAKAETDWLPRSGRVTLVSARN